MSGREEIGKPVDKPYPGSIHATEQGCTCPVMDNGGGRRGFVLGDWVFSGDCPVHGWGDGDRRQQ